MKRVVLAALLATLLTGLVASAGAAYQPIVLRGYTFDPLESVPQVPAGLRAPAPAPEQPAYYLVQCTGPIQNAWKTSLTGQGADLLGYTPEYAFAARMTPQEAADVAGLPFVRWVGAYQPAYELSPALPPGDDVTVSVVLWSDEDTTPVEQALNALGAVILKTAPGATWPVVRARVASDHYDDIAAIPAVSWVEEWRPPQKCNDVAQRLINVSPPDPGTDGAFDVWNSMNLFGAGQIAAVADTGLDTGDPDSLLLDFQGRVRGGISYVSGAGWEDPDGHGTHTAGSVLGNGTNSGSNAAAHYYTGSFAGMAPEAELVVQRILDETGWWGDLVPADLNDLFQDAYDAGARVHSNSWGDPFSTGDYDLWAMQADEFCWAHRDMTIAFSVGNEGVDWFEPFWKIDPSSLRSPGLAKNVISVGASESVRNCWWWWGDWGYGLPFMLDPIADNENGLAAFSSRGPTGDGRTKPDIVAPGTQVGSCLSQLVSPSSILPPNLYDPFYMFGSGTSMSCPLTAGAATLLRDYFTTVHQGRPNPSSALIKASLINCATEMEPGQYGAVFNTPAQEITQRPNNDEGWGRINVGAVTYATYGERGIYQREGTSRGIYFTDVPEAYGLGTGEYRDYWFSVVDSTHEFRATVAWTDYPGLLGAGKAVVNDLDVQVRGPMETGPATTEVVTWLGSGEGPAELVRLGAAPDRTNNVEGVDVGTPAPGWYRVRVIGFNVPQGSQNYALVVSGSLVKSFTISGMVTEPVYGTGVPGVRMEVRSLTSDEVVASTETSGFFELPDYPLGGYWEISGLSPGFYEVRPVPPNLAVEFSPPKRDITIGTEDLYGLNFEVSQGFTIKGRVTTVGGQSIPNVRVSIYDTDGVFEHRRAITNSDGYYEVDSLLQGSYLVIATKPGVGFDPEEGWIVSVGWGISYAVANFVGGVPYPTYYIWGYVRTPEQAGLRGVTLDITGGGQYRGDPVSLTASTGADGYYAKGGLPRGTYRVDASKEGYRVHPILWDGRVARAVTHTTTSVFMTGSHVDWQAVERDVGITSVTFDTGVLMAGRPAAMMVEVQNFSPDAENDVVVNVSYWNGQSTDSQTIPLLPGNRTETLTFNFTPPRAGPGTIHVEIPALPGERDTGNNARTMSVQVQGMGLSDGCVIPETGTPSTTFEWRVLYTHPDNVPPDQVWVAIRLVQTRPTWVRMNPLDPGDTDYTDGRWYTLSHALTQGTGAYRFALKAEDEWTYWPQPAGSYRIGPTVYPED